MFFLGAVITAMVMVPIAQRENRLTPSPSISGPASTLFSTASSLDALLAHPEKLTYENLLRTNLLCAEGLPGAEAINISDCEKTLSEWADHVASETKRNSHQYDDDPADYHNSLGYYKMLMLITVLQQDYGVKYDPQRINIPDFTVSRDLFLHGLLNPPHEGTCVSMPVLYAAVGRTLGYPIRLAVSKGHVFARWEGESERFNIEGTNQGLNTFSDDEYAHWPTPLTPEEMAGGWYLRSLTPVEELSIFLGARGHCLLDSGRYAEAQVAYAQAHRISPHDPDALAFLADAVFAEGNLPGMKRSPLLNLAALALDPRMPRQRQSPPWLDAAWINNFNALQRQVNEIRNSPQYQSLTSPGLGFSEDSTYVPSYGNDPGRPDQ